MTKDELIRGSINTTGRNAMNQPTSDDTTIAALTHIGGIFFGFIPSLIVWLIYKDKSPFVADQALEALNFQITMAIGAFACIILMLIVIGIFMIWVLGIVNLVLCIIAAIKASSGEQFRYPFALRLIK
jgi:uncharacterized protein